ncbi:MAG: CocE/NonD family hydrolase [Promethearchaeota archaeon]
MDLNIKKIKASIMIDWISLLSRVIGDLIKFLVNINELIYFTLPLTLLAIGIHVISFYMRYIKNELGKGSRVDGEFFKAPDIAFFIGRNVITAIFSLLSVYIALFFATLSLMVSSIYFSKMNANESRMNGLLKVISWFLYWTTPVILITLGIAFKDFFTIIPVIFALLVFFYWGKGYANISRATLLKKYELHFFKRIPLSIKYLIILISTIVPVIIVVGLYVGQVYFFEQLVAFINNEFNLRLMMLINLPLIITSVSTWFIFRRFALKMSNSRMRDLFKNEMNAGLNLSRKMKNHLVQQVVLSLIIGFLSIHATMIISTWLLLKTALSNVKLSQQEKKRPLLAFSFSCTALIVIFYIISILFYDITVSGISLAISISVSAVAFIFHGMKTTTINVEQAIENFKAEFEKRVPKVLSLIFMAFTGVSLIAGVVGVSMNVFSLKETFMIPMSDGTKLATDVYFSPSVGKNPAPVILIRTPYGKENMIDTLYTSLYLPRGYHVVIQDFRGTHSSEGKTNDFLLFSTSFTDGNDTINWILSQPWSNGKIGSAGISALCITEYLYAGLNPRGLKAQSLWFGCPDLFQDAIMEGAYHESSVETWINETAKKNWRYQIDFILDHMETMDWNVEEYNATTLNAGINTFENVNVSGLHVGGWYDHFLGGTIRGYMGYDDRGQPGARGHQRLIIGPWIHGMVFGGRQGELVYPSSSTGIPLIMKWETEMFNEAFQGIPVNWDGNRVAYYLMGDVDDPSVDANKWKFARDWPLNFSKNPWYFGKDDNDNLILVDDGNALESKNISYEYDPRDPVLTKGGNNQPSFDTSGPQDQRVAEELKNGSMRDDVLVFESEVLDKPYTMEGNLTARLHVKSNCTDTDFVVKLCDVYPDGRRMLIIDGALTSRFRNGLLTSTPLTPGEETILDINLIATAYQFNKGHKIAVTITSSNFDRYAINMNTYGPIGKEHFADAKVALNTIITGPNKSCIYFPELNE